MILHAIVGREEQLNILITVTIVIIYSQKFIISPFQDEKLFLKAFFVDNLAQSEFQKKEMLNEHAVSFTKYLKYPKFITMWVVLNLN